MRLTTGSIRRFTGMAAVGGIVLVGCGSSGSDTEQGVLTLPQDGTESTAFKLVPPTVASVPVTVPGSVAAPAGTWKYKVVLGDGSYVIAGRFDCKASDIVTANSWTDGVQHPLTIGETILLPASCDQNAVADAPPQTQAAGTSGDTPTASAGTYTVVANDTLYGIAEKLGTTLQALMDANGWTGDPGSVLIHVGGKIKVPAKS